MSTMKKLLAGNAGSVEEAVASDYAETEARVAAMVAAAPPGFTKEGAEAVARFVTGNKIDKDALDKASKAMAGYWNEVEKRMPTSITFKASPKAKEKLAQIGINLKSK